MHKLFSAAGVTLVAVLGLWLKLASVAPAAPDPGAERQRLDRFLASHGLQRSLSVRLSNQGGFSAASYRAADCAGDLLVLPLYRNAEGAHLLAQAARGARLGFVFRGRRYGEFPELPLAWDRLTTGLARHAPATPVLALAERGSCRLEQRLPWADYATRHL